jgi:hypothetical protein
MTSTHRSHGVRRNESAVASTRREPCHQLRVCPPHSWDCPVLTKIDPLAIAWTCSTCGAIVTGPVGEPAPNGSAALAG